jgi:hypothetical protein
MGRNLTPRQRKFIVTYVAMPNAAQAAIAAGYSRRSAEVSNTMLARIVQIVAEAQRSRAPVQQVRCAPGSFRSHRCSDRCVHRVVDLRGAAWIRPRETVAEKIERWLARLPYPGNTSTAAPSIAYRAKWKSRIWETRSPSHSSRIK